MRIEILLGLCGTLAFGGCATQNRWPGPPPAPPPSPAVTSAAPERALDVDAAVPVYGSTSFTKPAEEALPVDPSAPEPQPEEPTVEKKYAIP